CGPWRVSLWRLYQVNETDSGHPQEEAFHRMKHRPCLRSSDDLGVYQHVKLAMPVESAPASGAHVSKPVCLLAPGQGDNEAPIRCAAGFHGCPVDASRAASTMLQDGKTAEGAATREKD